MLFRSNILSVRAGVEAEIASLAKALPAGLHLDKTYDLAEFVEASIANVRDAILIGGLLAVLVLLWEGAARWQANELLLPTYSRDVLAEALPFAFQRFSSYVDAAVALVPPVEPVR